MVLTEKLIAKFWSSVERRSDGCWVWSKGKNSMGYGVFYIASKPYLAHRVAYLLANGRWPAQHCLHSCNTPACVCPQHLTSGSQAENLAYMVISGRSNKGTKHPSCKLTEAAVVAIRNDPRSESVIAVEHGVSVAMVGRIRRRERWAHIGEALQ
jgi:hypothetical protein